MENLQKRIDRIDQLGKQQDELNRKVEEIDEQMKGIQNDMCLEIFPLLVNWKPRYNDKAVYIDFYSKQAMYVWFTEMRQNMMRFKEVPNENKKNSNYMLQSTELFEDDQYTGIIIPYELFILINQTLNYDTLDKSNY
ncbi:MAG: hypothetical protein WCP85_26770 [Mariniphaga sp.]